MRKWLNWKSIYYCLLISINASMHVLMHFFHPLHPNIGMLFLHTVLYTFSKVLIRRICSSIKSWWSFPLFLWPKCLIQGWYGKEKWDANHSNGTKGYNSRIISDRDRHTCWGRHPTVCGGHLQEPRHSLYLRDLNHQLPTRKNTL